MDYLRNSYQRIMPTTCESLPPPAFQLPSCICCTPSSEREAPPRFPQPGSLEYDVAMRWKQFFEQEKAERDELEEKIKGMKAAIQKDMDTIKEQHQTLMLRQGVCVCVCVHACVCACVCGFS